MLLFEYVLAANFCCQIRDVCVVVDRLSVQSVVLQGACSSKGALTVTLNGTLTSTLTGTLTGVQEGV